MAAMGFSATEIAFLIVGCQQAVCLAGWLMAAVLLPDTRRACLHWAGYAALSGASAVLLVAATRSGIEPLRGLANLAVVGSLVALHRGLGVFFVLEPRTGLQLALLALAMVVTVIGLDPAHGALRVLGISLVLTALAAAAAWDLARGTRGQMAAGWRALLVLPLAAGGAIFASRAAHALREPEAIVAIVTANSMGNARQAIAYLLLAFVFQLTLVALVVSRYVGELKRASRHDALTGLLNRRSIEDELAAEIERARRLGQGFAVLMIDADHFKAINDTHGHAAGDRALQHLASLMGAQMRRVDRLGRMGGVEFLMLLPAAARDEGMHLAERLVDCVRGLPLVWNERPLALTVSIGVAEWQGDGDAPHALLARADVALYRAKGAGRDRVAAADGAPNANVIDWRRGART